MGMVVGVVLVCGGVGAGLVGAAGVLGEFSIIPLVLGAAGVIGGGAIIQDKREGAV